MFKEKKAPLVCKFGGTSVGTSSSIQRVCEIIRKEKPSFVVVSAVAGVTDLLEEFCRAPVGQKSQFTAMIREKHESIAKELGIDVAIEPFLGPLKQFEGAGHLQQEDQAKILAIGEDLSASLICSYCRANSLQLEQLEARQVILTDSQFLRAEPDLALMQTMWGELVLKENTIYLMQGFLGATASGATTVLGRGGSDFSASLVGELCEARELRIYTDVRGVHTADPKILKDTQLIDFLTFEEMQELASSGSKVLHQDMLKPCIRAKVPIFVTSTFDLTKEGTWICASLNEGVEGPEIKALSLKANQALWFVEYHSPLMRLENVLRCVRGLGSIPGVVMAQNSGVYFTVDWEENNQSMTEALREFGAVSCEGPVSLVALVGAKLTSWSMTGVFDALQGTPVLYWSQTDTVINLIINEESGVVVTKLLHDYVLGLNRSGL
ncbi:aspartate kinase [Chlamydia trachomatis]|jgi:aspartate kinase|uniref:Aspartokinase n=2 Tax=Chlamydia muridarum TaxID=83560 RepID=AK_CHLMU|nr:aspartate kinase [Chlamydia muridarum]Q9PK32.1 RecName: Full=Aspartokinase; AltName: Full=Aspartate kinase [Chlamydia muridarum str. Nigg]UFT44029.1 aspartate kinase [Chlamydia trachomatis]AAF39470.1 aspartokinase III [Chlamydia muridarum str. Nigg]AHH23027.1 aspartate kinase [Chlamydia muridarum str. Nigg3 CMUT3-5]AHH23952.1 aspartate kinase [Chlamydia muridarum str. Nigg CM972]AID38159.1 aspartate kinase [Chlamydia muridarum str. Nigg 2 MCR]